MTARRDTLAGVLSYAEQRALEIGVTIASDADVILLDEPTAGMSRGEADHAVALIRSVSQGRTLVIVEHDMSVVPRSRRPGVGARVWQGHRDRHARTESGRTTSCRPAYLGTAQHA